MTKFLQIAFIFVAYVGSAMLAQFYDCGERKNEKRPIKETWIMFVKLCGLFVRLIWAKYLTTPKFLKGKRRVGEKKISITQRVLYFPIKMVLGLFFQQTFFRGFFAIYTMIICWKKASKDRAWERDCFRVLTNVWPCKTFRCLITWADSIFLYNIMVYIQNNIIFHIYTMSIYIFPYYYFYGHIMSR